MILIWTYYYNYFFSLSKKIIFFSPILANNNLPFKIYCESIVKILWQYFSILISYSLFYFILFLLIHISSFFFPSTHVPFIFFPYFLLSSFSMPLPPHTCSYFFFFISLFRPFPFHFTLYSRMFHTLQTPLSSLSLCISFFFFLTVRKLMMMKKKMKMMMMMKKSMHLFFRLFSLFPYFLISYFLLYSFFFFTLQRRWWWWWWRWRIET